MADRPRELHHSAEAVLKLIRRRAVTVTRREHARRIHVGMPPPPPRCKERT